MKKYNVSYKAEVFTTNGQVKPDGFSSLEFIRKGDENVTVINAIPLDSDTPSYEFINRRDEKIQQNFDFKFAGGGSDPKLIVVKTYYEEE